MKAFWEIGLVKSIKFIIYTLIEFILSIVFIPQLKIILLRLLGAKIGKNSLILNPEFMNLYRGGFSHLIIGDNCYIGRNVLLDLTGKIIIGDHVTIAERAMILTHLNIGYKDHPLQKLYPSHVKDVYIEKGSFIGAGSIILAGITINKQSLVGAGSVVTKNVFENTVVVGVPAKKVKKLINE